MLYFSSCHLNVIRSPCCTHLYHRQGHFYLGRCSAKRLGTLFHALHTVESSTETVLTTDYNSVKAKDVSL